MPGSSDPGNGTMVLAGHRFKYLPPNNTTFYNLDKLQKNDAIYIIWGKKLYTYTIIMTRTVPSNDIQALQSNADLILITCTPLWSAQNRLLVYAIQRKS